MADGTPDELRARERGGRYRVVVESNGVPRRPSAIGWPAWRASRAACCSPAKKARTRSSSTRRHPATCASRSSARPSTTAGRCSSWRANRPAWKTCFATSPLERKTSHEPGTRHLAAGVPHLLQFSRRLHRGHRVHGADGLPVLPAAVRRGASRHARLLRQHAHPVHVPGAGDHHAPAGRREGVGHAGAADHHAGPRLGRGAGQVPRGDGAAVHGAGADGGVRDQRPAAGAARSRSDDRRLHRASC